MSDDRATPCLHLDDARQACSGGQLFPQDCGTCAHYVPGLNDHERTRCELWSRVMGYHRQVSRVNAGKQQHKDRKFFIERPGDLSPTS